MIRNATFALTAALTGLGLLAAGGTEARASYQVVLEGNAPVDVGGGLYRYDYTVSIPQNASEWIVDGDFVRINDFLGYQSSQAAILPAGWSVSSSNTNALFPPSVILQHGDDPGVANVTFTYHGPNLTAGGTLGTFSIFSNYGQIDTNFKKDFVGISYNASTNSNIDTRGDAYVPVPGPLSPNPVPEPAALISGGLGLAFLGLGYARRTRLGASA